METLLTPEDSKRVADALIRKINNSDIQEAVRSAMYHSLNDDYLDGKLGTRIVKAVKSAIEQK